MHAPGFPAFGWAKASLSLLLKKLCKYYQPVKEKLPSGHLHHSYPILLLQPIIHLSCVTFHHRFVQTNFEIVTAC